MKKGTSRRDLWKKRWYAGTPTGGSKTPSEGMVGMDGEGMLGMDGEAIKPMEE